MLPNLTAGSGMPFYLFPISLSYQYLLRRFALAQVRKENNIMASHFSSSSRKSVLDSTILRLLKDKEPRTDKPNDENLLIFFLRGYRGRGHWFFEACRTPFNRPQ